MGSEKRKPQGCDCGHIARNRARSKVTSSTEVEAYGLRSLKEQDHVQDYCYDFRRSDDRRWCYDLRWFKTPLRPVTVGAWPPGLPAASQLAPL